MYADDYDDDGKWYLEYSEYPACCGIEIIYEFPQENCGISILDVKESIFQEFKKNLDQCIKSRKGMVQVVLNHWQRRHFGSMLKELKFKRGLGFYNPNSNNRCYLYIKLLSQPTKVKDKDKLKTRRFH